MTNEYCCSVLKYLVEDERTYSNPDGKLVGVWTSRLPENGDWEPEILELKYCPNCGKDLSPGLEVLFEK